MPSTRSRHRIACSSHPLIRFICHRQALWLNKLDREERQSAPPRYLALNAGRNAELLTASSPGSERSLEVEKKRWIVAQINQRECGGSWSSNWGSQDGESFL